MAKEVFYCKYETDYEEEIIIKISYDADPATAPKTGMKITKSPTLRLQEGKLEKQESGCLWTLSRRDFEPRYLIIEEFGKVYFYSHDDFIQYIKDNKGKVKRAVGEVSGCKALSIFTPDKP